jgi:transposase
MEVRRTVPVRLDVDSDDAQLLDETINTFLWCANYAVDTAFEGKYVTTSKSKLDAETYDNVKEQTGFNTALIQASRNKAAEACKSVVEKWKNGEKANKPRFTSPHVVYDSRTATFYDDYVSLATVDGRIEAEYILPDEGVSEPHDEYLYGDDYERTGAELHKTNGKWMLHIHFKREREDTTPEQATAKNPTVLGVDLGVNNLAVTSTGMF